jgi:hypothetical protein
MKRWRLVIGVVVVFILGVLVGSLGTQLYQRQWSERFWKDPAERRALFLRRLTRELRLTEEQQKEFKVIIAETDKNLEALHRERRTEVKKILDESFSRMKEKLNPDQQQKLEELRAKHEARSKDVKRRRHFP